MEIKLLPIFLMILSAVFGVTVGEVYDEKIKIPFIEDSTAAEAETSCPAAKIIIAYMPNGDKYYGQCNGLGPSCELTKSEEILTELG